MVPGVELQTHATGHEMLNQQSEKQSQTWLLNDQWNHAGGVSISICAGLSLKMQPRNN